jgi:NhaP-type Na+/H+ or K+/H+ antiporter
VIVVSALLSGLAERTGFPPIAVFLALGLVLGPHGAGLLEIGLDSPFLRVVATLGLALVLFTDAVSLNMAEVRRHGRLALRLLGPGTLLSAALLTLAAWRLLELSVPMSLVLGASLASTDPVLLRGLLRRSAVPADARQALRLESGLNDVVLLPIVVVALSLAASGAGGVPVRWGTVALDLFVLGPGAGVLIGLAGVAALGRIRRRFGVRRDYESLYSLGLAFAAYAAAEAVHGSGFLAAFAAGLTVAALDVELCDCFLEYGEVTAEMLLLLTFVLFGTSLIWTGLAVLGPAAAAFAALAILGRVPVYLLSLAGSGLDRRSSLYIAWFGGRGLSSLLLVLLAVFAGLPESVQSFQVCCLVVLLSVVLHGGSSMALGRSAGRRARDTRHGPAAGPEAQAAPARQPGSGTPAEAGQTPADRQRITLDELHALSAAHAAVVLADVRTERTHAPSPHQAQGAVRLDPEAPVHRARVLGLPPDAWIVTYCT